MKHLSHIAQMRREYGDIGIDRHDVNVDPIAQFEDWFTQAIESNVIDPNAMSLATVSADGQPSLRTVLLKSYDLRGFVFFTNLRSRKAREIATNSKVSLLFPWLALQRQVVISGVAERLGIMETLAYFVTRPRGSQISAWVSNQSQCITSRRFLEMEWQRMKDRFERGEVPLPPFWGGFRVVPHNIEFWQGRTNRLHDRFNYQRETEGRWVIERLAP